MNMYHNKLMINTEYDPDDFLEHQWQQVCANSTYYTSTLSVQYAEPWRFYHNKNHLVDLFTKLGAVRMNAETETKALITHNLAALTYAVFFHDAVYHPHQADNEEKSADQWLTFATATALAPLTIEQVRRLILATKNHRQNVDDPLTALFLDLDLSILGSSPELFAAYDHSIAQEYASLDPVVYQQKRQEFLQSMSNPYHTPYFKTHFGNQTAQNIARSLANH